MTIKVQKRGKRRGNDHMNRPHNGGREPGRRTCLTGEETKIAIFVEEAPQQQQVRRRHF